MNTLVRNTSTPGVINQIADDKLSAIALLNQVECWEIGWMCSVLYKIANANNTDNIRVLTAVGIKNSNVTEQSDENITQDSMSISGSDFYQIIADSNTAGGGLSGLNETEINLNGSKFRVVNATGNQQMVEDPFKIKEILPIN